MIARLGSGCLDSKTGHERTKVGSRQPLIDIDFDDPNHLIGERRRRQLSVPTEVPSRPIHKPAPHKAALFESMCTWSLEHTVHSRVGNMSHDPRVRPQTLTMGLLERLVVNDISPE